MSHMKDAQDYATQFPPEPGMGEREYATAIYSLTQESLRSMCGSPYSSFDTLDKETQEGWIALAKTTAKGFVAKLNGESHE